MTNQKKFPFSKRGLVLILLIEALLIGWLAFVVLSFFYPLSFFNIGKHESARQTQLYGSPTPTIPIDAKLPSRTVAPEQRLVSTPTIVFSSPTPSPTGILPTAVNTPILPTPTVTPIPESGELFVIGYSVKMNPIQVARFGTGPAARLIVAGIHGGYEWNTVDLANAFIDTLKSGRLEIPPGKTLYILPLLNPDGYARDFGDAGRLNENGVDINRNFDAFWSETWITLNCWTRLPVSAGKAPASEPETRALVQFITEHPNIDALISYHSAGLGIFAGGKGTDPSSEKLAEALASVSPYPYPPVDNGCQYTGQLADWAAIHSISAVDIELSNHHDIEFEVNLRILREFLAWTP
jgi:hypothetical protein